jgi:cytochrome b561
MMTSYHGFPTYFFGLEFEPLVEKSDVYIIWGTFHKYLFPYVLYIVLGAHILGAMKHHFIDRHSAALKRMVG